MVTSQYSYNGKLWRPCAAVSDENSFFHTAFGVKAGEDEVYFDKHATFRRRRWLTFLTYFENEAMPPLLADTLMKCFSANNKYMYKSIKDKNHIENYVLDIMAGQHVIKEEIPILSALENITIVLLLNKGPDPVLIVNPVVEIFGNYSHVLEKPRKEVVLCLEGRIFSRLEPIGKDLTSKLIRTKSETVKDHLRHNSCLSRYQKGGNAGSKGIEFQVRLLTILLLNSVGKFQNWKLSTENKKAGKFDDAVLEWPEGAFLIQAKHKEKTKKISCEELLSTNSKSDDFSLPKYFLSYQEIKTEFKNKNIIVICTNVGVHEKALQFLDNQKICSESMLYCANDDYSFYTFNMKILPHLKENVEIYLEKNCQNKNIDPAVLTDKNLKDFLERLQFYSKYPIGVNAEKVPQKLVSILKHFGNFYDQISFSEIYVKVLEWFQRKNGIYLTEIIAKAMFLEIKSDRYLLKLEQYNVFFQGNLLTFPNKAKLYHVNAEGGYLLQELKIYHIFKTNESKLLYANPSDGIELQQILEAFELPFYTVLLISCSEDIKESEVHEIFGKLREILDYHEEKKVVLVTESNHNLVKEIELNRSVCNINGFITFQDFSHDFQLKLLQKKVIFQGTYISLQELLETQTNQDWVKFQNELSSEILEKLVQGEHITVGLAVHSSDKYICPYYIERVFMREIEKESVDKAEIITKSEETVLEENIYEVKDKIILIADAAGTGKSTVLSHLAVTIKKKNPLMWVIRLELSNYTEILKQFKKENKAINIIALLNSKNTTKLSNQLEKVLFSMNRKVVLLIDGVDEISPDYTELVVRLLDQCQGGSNLDKVFVTTRPNMTQKLKSILFVKPFMLLPFTEHNQIRFLTNYWAYNLELDNATKKKYEKYARKLLRTTSSWTKHGENNFTSTPLQIRMIADIVQSNDESEESTDRERCLEYLKANEIVPKLLENNITKLYQMFIAKKKNIFRSKGNPSGNTTANQALDDQFEQCLVYHRILALKMILSKSECELFAHYLQATIEPKILKMGIVQASDSNFYFIHITFAEYFVAESLLSELQLPIQSQKFQKFFFDEILLKAKFKVVRGFLNNFINETLDYLPSNIFESYLSLRYDVDMKANCYLIHNLAEEGCAAILRLLFKCIGIESATDKKFNISEIQNIHRYEYNSANTLIILHLLMCEKGIDISDKCGYTPLLYAIQGGHLEMVKFLFEQGAELNPMNSEVKPLWLAIQNLQFNIVKFMVQHGIDMKTRDNQESILYAAISTNHVNMIEYLLDNTLKCNKWEDIDSIIPYTFAYLGRLNLLKDLVKEGLNVNSIVENQETLLFGAVRGGQLDTIKYLVDQGADINARDAKGNTILHLTNMGSSFIWIAKLLIELGINVQVEHLDGNIELLFTDVNDNNKQAQTALYNTAGIDTLDTMEFLLGYGSDVNAKNSCGETALHSAAVNGQLDTVKSLVTRYGANVNVTDNYGSTPLHSAVSTGQLDIITFLVEYGADFHIKNIDGSTALHAAAFWSQRNVVDYLVKVGADVNVTDNNNRTALHVAAHKGELDIVECLVKLGGDVSLKDNSFCTALHLSILNDKRDIVKFLSKSNTNDIGVNEDSMAVPIDYENIRFKYILGKTTLHFAAEEGDLNAISYHAELGVNLNITDRRGHTPLHYAAWGGQLDAAKFLVQLGSDINIKDKDGLTTLHWAASKGHRDMVEFFLECGVDVNIRADSGLAALHYAAQEGYLDVVKYLIDHNASILPCI